MDSSAKGLWLSYRERAGLHEGTAMLERAMEAASQTAARASVGEERLMLSAGECSERRSRNRRSIA